VLILLLVRKLLLQVVYRLYSRVTTNQGQRTSDCKRLGGNFHDDDDDDDDGLQRSGVMASGCCDDDDDGELQ